MGSASVSCFNELRVAGASRLSGRFRWLEPSPRSHSGQSRGGFGEQTHSRAVGMIGWNLAFLGGSATTPSTVCTRARRMFGGPEVSGCSHGLVGRSGDIGGCVDKAAAGWFGERDDLVGRDLMWGHPPHRPARRRALGMVHGWPQQMQSAAQLGAVLPPDPMISANSDPIAILAAMGKAVGRGLAAGHWPGRGPRDEAWEHIAWNFVQARRLLQEQPVASKAVSTDWPDRPNRRQHADIARAASRRSPRCACPAITAASDPRVHLGRSTRHAHQR